MAKGLLRRTRVKANLGLSRLRCRGNTTPESGTLPLGAWDKSLRTARTASAEAFGDAAAAVADVAMDGAMDAAKAETKDAAKCGAMPATMGVSAARSRAIPGPRLRVSLLRLLRERRNQAGPSSSDRRPDISRSCFREN